MTLFRDLLEQASGLVASVVGASLGSLRDEEVLIHVADVERLGRLVDALRVAAAHEVDERSGLEHGEASLSRRHQCATSAILIEQLTRTSQSEAARRVRIARATAERLTLTGEVLPAAFEHVSASLAAGELGLDAAAVIIRHLTDASRSASPSAVRDAEAHLVDQAATLSASLVDVQAHKLCAALDPDGVRPREELLRQRRRFRLGREVDGLTPFSGLADPINAGLLRAALTERTAPSRTPRFVDLDDPDVSLEAEQGPRDRRSREQRAFDIVFGLITAGIRADNDTVGSLHGTATVNVVITARDLVAGTGAAWIDDTLTPVSAATAREITCDGGVQLQIHSDKGQILWEGYRERYFTPAQRRALAVRDGGCVGPGCLAPPSWCHAHHVIEWEHGGRTDVDNGALLCAFHHHQLHAGGFQLRMTHGIPELLAPPWFDREQQWRPASKTRLPRAA
jgi:hypothetical protein